MSAPTKSTTRPWISSVRFEASSGWKISGSRFRVDVPLTRAPNRRAAKATPTAVLRPSSATAMPTKPTAGRGLDVARREPELPAEDVDRAGETGEGAGDRHREEVVAGDADAAVARRLGVEADRLDAVAERRPVEDYPVDDERAERDEEADVEALEQRIAPEDRQLRPLGDVVRDRRRAPACRSGAARRGRRGSRPTQSAIQLSMIVVITSCAPTVAFRKPAIPAHAAPQSIAASTARSTCRNGFMPLNVGADPDGEDRAHQVLALAADVEHAAAEGERDREPREDQRCREDQRLLEVERRERSGRRSEIQGKNQLSPEPSKIAW